MTWTRLSDAWPDDPRVLEVESRSARLLHVEALIYCNKHLTDGRIARRAVRRCSDSEDLDVDIAELVGAGLWTVLEPDVWQVDWTDQEKAERVLARQDAAAARKARHVAHTSGDHTDCNPKTCSGARARTRSGTDDGTQGGTATGTDAVTPSRPDPTRPGPKEAGSRSGATSEPSSTGRLCSAGAIIGTDGTCCAQHEPPTAGGLVVVR